MDIWPAPWALMLPDGRWGGLKPGPQSKPALCPASRLSLGRPLLYPQAPAPCVFRAPPAALGLGAEEGCQAVKGLQLGPMVHLLWGVDHESVTWNSSYGFYPGQSSGVQQVLSLSFVGVVSVSQSEA